MLKALFLSSLVILSGLQFGGCTTSSKFRTVEHPGAPFNFGVASSNGQLEGIIHTVIFFQGPGSWKEKALWDEYVIQLKNNGTEAIILNKAELIDLLDTAQVPGTDPWDLEKLSKDNWKHYGESGLSLAMGTLGVAAGAGLLATSAYLGGSASAAAGIAALPWLVGGYVIGVQVVNRKNAKEVDSEFETRKIDFPVLIDPGESGEGSLFFPTTPGPKRLILFDDKQIPILTFELSETDIGSLHMEQTE